MIKFYLKHEKMLCFNLSSCGGFEFEIGNKLNNRSDKLRFFLYKVAKIRSIALFLSPLCSNPNRVV